MSPLQSPPAQDSSLVTIVIAVAGTLGATGLAALLKVWLENRRLQSKEYRKTLADRITELESIVGRLQEERAKSAEREGRLEAEVLFLREQLHDRDSKDHG